MKNLYNNTNPIDDNQYLYDAFNTFIFSDDRSVFNKMWAKMYFYEMTKDLHGDIVECGVFKGSGLAVWLKLLDMYEPNSIKKVLGFDYFDPDFVHTLDNHVDREVMGQVFKRCNATKSELSKFAVEDRLFGAGFSDEKFELHQGNVFDTTYDLISLNPGFRISILYLDMDLEEPTTDALNNLWSSIVPGGVVVFDEYAYHAWSESNSVDKFIKKHSVKLHKLNIKSPTAYIIK